MEKFLTEHKEIDAVLSANDSMALGVLEALKAANRTAIVIGINGILPAVKQIETGGMLATVDFNMFKIGCTATRAAVRHLKNEPLPEKVMLPAEVIDKTNYKAWLVPVDQRTCPEWATWRAERQAAAKEVPNLPLPGAGVYWLDGCQLARSESVLARHAFLRWPLGRKPRSPGLNAGRAPLRRRRHRRRGRRTGALNVHCSLRPARGEQAR